MATEEVKEEIVESSPAERTRAVKIFDAITIILLVNLVLEIIVTAIATILVNDYFSPLAQVGVIGIAGFVVILVVTLLLSAGVYEFGRRLGGWEEEKASNALMYTFLVIGGLMTVILLAGLYIVASTMDPLLDPFGLADINPALGLIYSLWWFFGFSISILLLAVLVLIIWISAS